MATEIVTDALPVSHEAQAVELQPPYTPKDHAKASDLKVIRLIELVTTAHGPAAKFEFMGGFVRSLDIDAQTVWHPLFKGIENQDWWRLLKHAAPRTKCADGTVVVQNGPMWFWTRRTTSRGRHLDSNYFDVPSEGYSAGRLTGTRAARDLILFLKEYGVAHVTGPCSTLNGYIQTCLQQAFALARARCYGGAPGADNAAITFCDLITAYFAAGSANANPAYLDERVEREEKSLAWSVEYYEEKRLENLEKMRALRAAKAANKTTGDKSGKAKVGRSAMLSQLLKSQEGVASAGHTLQ